jgi:hypothetical protein
MERPETNAGAMPVAANLHEGPVVGRSAFGVCASVWAGPAI